jgi:hypothetical protein
VKTLSKKAKYITLCSSILIAVFAFTHSASAASSQYSHTCSDGGTVTTTVTTSQDGPFNVNSLVTLSISGQILSTCTPRNINLTAQNNGATPVTVTGNVIPTTFFTGLFPIVPINIFSSSFSVPNPAGTYEMHFVTGVEEPNPVISGTVKYQCADFNGHNGWGILTFNFNQPTPVQLNLKMAATTIDAWYPSQYATFGLDLFNQLVFPGQTTPPANFCSVPYNPNTPGYAGGPYCWINPPVTGFNITIPAGSTAYSPGHISQNGNNFSCRKGHGNGDYGPNGISSHIVPNGTSMVLQILNNTGNFQLNLTGTSYNRPNAPYTQTTYFSIGQLQ